MSTTFYVEGWDKQPSVMTKMYFHDQYPGLDLQYAAVDPSYKKDENGYYTFERVYANPFPTANMSGSMCSHLFYLLKLFHKDSDCGTLECSEIPAVRRAIMKLLNEEIEEVEPFQDGNVIECGISDARILLHLNSLSRLLAFAQERKVSVYWA